MIYFARDVLLPACGREASWFRCAEARRSHAKCNIHLLLYQRCRYRKKLAEILEKNGIKCFFAPRDIESGTDYATEIVKAIKNLDCVTHRMNAFPSVSDHVIAKKYPDFYALYAQS